ncbi:MAG: hypothetical protein J5802_09915 [Butyrivibrio sp.]|nr:hypothetical protein [Butyrivibrio sp.]
MLNEEKVILMTKMAAFIDREGKKNDAINSYFKGDYVAFNVIKSIISATIVFIMLIAAYVIYDFETILSNAVDPNNLLSIGRRLLINYLLLVGVYSLISYIVYSYRYSRMRRSMRAYYENLKKLARMYEKEQ